MVLGWEGYAGLCSVLCWVLCRMVLGVVYVFRRVCSVWVWTAIASFLVPW